MANATITITISNASQAKIDDIVDNISNEVGWVEDPENLGFNIEGGSKSQHIKKAVIEYLKGRYRKGKARTQPVDMADFDASLS